MNRNREEGYRWTEISPGFFSNRGFREVDTTVTNIPFETHLTPGEIDENQILLNGTGVATADVDGDGLADIYFTQLNGPNRLFKNLGNFEFEDITAKAGVGHEGNYSTGALFADVDGDGDQDLLIATVDGNNAVYQNDGGGKFALMETAGLAPGNGSTSLTMADIDSDGDLDLYMANSKKKPVFDIFDEEKLDPRKIVKRPEGKQVTGKTRYEFLEPFGQYYRFIYRKNKRAIFEEVGEFNHLYINDGSGHFTEVTNEKQRFSDRHGNPAELKPEWSLTARLQDINGDGLPDLYVCNDYFTPDRVWLNRGDGRFKEADYHFIRNFSYSSMGVAVGDINRDDHSDIFVTEMLSQNYSRRMSQQVSVDMRPGMVEESHYQPQYMRNSLYLNRGDNTFAEISHYSGTEASEWSWATRFMDVDLDGFEDLIITTGYPYDAMDQDYGFNSQRYKGSVNLKEAPDLKINNKIFRNNGDLTFTDRSKEWGFAERDVSYGLSAADLDNDGDLDIIISRFGSGAAIYENVTTAPRIAVRLQGRPPNTAAIGAKITLKGGPVTQTQQVVSGGDYQSGSTNQAVFAADRTHRNHQITVRWADGGSTVIDSAAANRLYLIDEPEKKNVSENSRLPEPARDPIFREISGSLAHSHEARSFQDFEYQPLLPFKLSQNGPGISWIDYDRDGNDDLFIGNGRNGFLQVYRNRGGGDFEKISLPAGTGRGHTAIVGWDTEDESYLTAGHSNYFQSDVSDNGPSATVLRLGEDGTVTGEAIRTANTVTGPVAAADYDLDGDIDLFAGGRAIPDKYPADASSGLFTNQDSVFLPDEENGTILQNAGLVTGAVFSDYNLDGYPDLILSTEWGPVKLFKNERGLFREVTEEVGLDDFRGLWNSVSTGDFNNDGLPDIIAANFGENHPYRPDRDHPLVLYYGDFNMDGKTDMIEAKHSSDLDAYVPVRRLYDYPIFSYVLSTKVKSYGEYARTPLKDLLNIPLDQFSQKKINTMQHLLFINRGNGFEPYPLPAEAQFTAAFDATVADFNNDGNEDVFLSQNFFGVRPDITRMDAGRGQLLLGNGDGAVSPVPGQLSGLEIYGQQRGAAVSDFNKDGKVDLAVGQHDSTTKLYVNQTPNKGIRIFLNGPSKNRTAVGSGLRLIYKDGSRGPLREIQAGSGYRSQNSATQILGISTEKKPGTIRVRWPGGRVQDVPFQTGKSDYNISCPTCVDN